MNIEYYNAFLEYQEKGLKKKAAECIQAFISSFESEDEIRNWVWSNLEDLVLNRHSRIRHEIFSELVYPVLKRGYLKNDFESTLWLGKLIQNVYQAPALHEELAYITAHQLFRKCYRLNPENQEARALLLKNIIDWLAYCVHEWPSGILYGRDGATLAQCREIREEIEFAITLDENNRYRSFLRDVRNKLIQYEAGLNT